MKANRKNYIIAALAIALFVSIIFHLPWDAGIRIIGTYVHGDQVAGDALALVFLMHGFYVKHCQTEIISYGAYELLADNIYTLTIFTDNTTTQILRHQDTVYVFNQYQQILPFERISRSAIIPAAVGFPDFSPWQPVIDY